MKHVSVIPEICVHDARGALAFYKKAFGAKELATFATPDGKKIMHGALEIGGGVVFVCDDFPEQSGGKARTPKALGGSPVTIHLNRDDVKKTWKTSLAAGAKVVLPLEKQFWGDTYGIVEDPFGQRWSMSPAHDETKTDVESDEYKAGAEVLYPTKKKARRSPKTPPRKTRTKAKTKGRK